MERKENEARQKVKGLQRLAGFLEVPASSIANVTHIELEGNTQVRIENSGGILEYEKERIRIKTGKVITEFTGRNLEIKCLSAEIMEIHGYLTNINFVTQ